MMMEQYQLQQTKILEILDDLPVSGMDNYTIIQNEGKVILASM